MKKVFIIALLFCSISFARTSYWGVYEDEMRINLGKPNRTVGDFTLVLSAAVDEIATDSRWGGTRKEAHDLFRNMIATQMGITPPANWDSEISEVEDVTIDFMKFLDEIVVNDKILTKASKIAILDFARTNATFE